MIKEELAPGIFVYSDVVDNSVDFLVNIEKSINPLVANWHASQVNGTENKKIRDTDSINVPYQDKIFNTFLNSRDKFQKTASNIFLKYFSPIEKDYMKNFYVNLSEHEDYSILRYSNSQKFTDHIDDAPFVTRRISLVYYINDDYHGGEINFPRFGISYKPKANQLLLFPSTYVYNHSVSEVTEGTRYCVVSWIK
jgi:hypothetical protein